MPQKATVDKLLAESFKELVATIPIEKITIKEILRLRFNVLKIFCRDLWIHRSVKEQSCIIG